MSEIQPPDTFAALEKREWANAGLARSYAQVFAKAADMVVPHLVKAVGAGPGVNVLDLCCGHGNVASGLVEAGARVTGLDFSPAMLDMARAAVPNAQFVEGDAMALEFEDASFEAVTIGFGMPHVPDPVKVIAEARRVLRLGGRLAFSVWCGPAVSIKISGRPLVVARCCKSDIPNGYHGPHRTFDQTAANGSNEPTLQIFWNAANVGF